jgi:Holliday junction resolvase RusA-like endonuclease
MSLCSLTRVLPDEVVFSVHGRPAQMGSKRAFVVKGRAVMTNTNSDSLRQWYTAVASTAAGVMRGSAQVTGPVRLSMRFYFKRPKNHYRTGKNANVMKDTAPVFHSQSPDLDKLIRSTQDALSSVVWRDDSQVCQYGNVSRAWSEDGVEGAEIAIELLDSGEIEHRESDMTESRNA